MRRSIIIILSAFLMLAYTADAMARSESTRQERRLIMKGNKQYVDRKFVEAANSYTQALSENPASAEARYNLALSQLRQVSNPADTTPKAKNLIGNAVKNFEDVASRAKDKPGIASKANYNLGNLEFNRKDYAKAISYYKQALRINPDDDAARKNLRIAQKQLQNQDKNKNDKQKQDQDKQKQDQDKQDKQNQQNQQNQQNEEKQPPKDKEISQQTASRILQAVDNKEAQTRAKVNRATKGDKSTGNGRSRKRW